MDEKQARIQTKKNYHIKNFKNLCKNLYLIL